MRDKLKPPRDQNHSCDALDWVIMARENGLEKKIRWYIMKLPCVEV